MRQLKIIRRGSALVLAGCLAGSAAADVLTWTGSCGTRDWSSCCHTDTPDGPVFRLNWDRPESTIGCPPLPGLIDDVILPAGADVILNNSAEINSIDARPSSSFELTSGSLVNSAPSTIAGDFTWSGGNFGGAGELVIESPVVFSGASARNIFDKTLRIDDSLIWIADDSARIQLGTNARLVNAGMLAMLSNARIAGPSGTFRNEGDVLLFGTGTTRIDARVENVGAVEIASGVLLVQTPNLQWGGATYVRSGAQLSLVNGGQILDDAAFAGPGLVRVSDGVFTIGTNVSFDNLELAGADMTGGDVLLNQSFNWLNGGLRGAGETIIGPNATATVPIGGSRVLDRRRLVNRGLVRLSNSTSPVQVLDTGAFVNEGALEIVGAGLPLTSAAPAQSAAVQNNGVFKRTGQPGTATVAAAIANTGEVLAETGVLELQRGGTHVGLIHAAAGAEVRLNGGNWTFQAGARIGGPGPTTLQTEITLNGAAEFERVTLQNGSIMGVGSLTITGQLQWLSGSIRGESNLDVAENARIEFGPTTALLQRRRLVNHGVLNFPGAGSLSASDSAVIENHGVMSFASQSYSVVGSGATPQLINHGRIQAVRVTIPVSAELQIPAISDGEILAVGDNVGMNFRRGLTQNGGETRLDRASMIASPYALNDGVLTGVGTIRGEVTQFGGVIRPGLEIGALAITNRYIQNSGALEIEIRGSQAGQYDVLTPINCELHGTLELRFDAEYRPHVGDAFDVITAGQSLTGQFASVIAPPTVAVSVGYLAQQRRVVVTIERLIGDVDCDGAINNFDIDAFVLALSDPALFSTIYPDCRIDSADVNRDGTLNNFDIEPFVECIANGACF